MVSRRNGTRGDGMEVAESMVEWGHMARSSRVVQLGLNFGLASGVRCGVGSLCVRLVVVNFFDGGPSPNVRLGCVCTVIAVVVVTVFLVATIVMVIAPVVLAAVALTVVIAVVVSSRRALAFLAAPFTPTFCPDVSELVAVVAFDVACVMLLLCVCGKSFIIAVVVFVAKSVVVFVMYELDGSVGCDGRAYLVSSCGEGEDDGSVGEREGAK